MKTSENGIRFTAAWEKFSPMPYFATQKERERGIYTWGYGHTGTRPPKARLTQADGLAILSQDVKEAEGHVTRWAHPSITQPVFDALVDLVFNAGPSSIQADNVTGDFDDLVRFGKWDDVITQLEFFRKQAGVIVPGLVRRSLARQALANGMRWQDAEAVGRNARV